MSRLYRMEVEISNFEEDKVDDISDAIQEWSDVELYVQENLIEIYDNFTLKGGESEEEFSNRLAVVVWKANGGYCNVLVKATCLEDLPRECCTPGKEYYELLKKAEVL